MTIGRSPAAEVQIDDQYASARHARLFEQEGVAYLEDFGSTNGTYLNDHRVQSQEFLRENDRSASATPSSGTSNERRARRAGAPVLRVVEEAARTDTGRQRTATRTPTSRARRCTRSLTGWAAPRPARSPRASPPRHSRTGRRRTPTPSGSWRASPPRPNRRIFELAREDATRTGMGTTLTGALLTDHEISIVHVGDSRAYLLRDGELRQLTRDHSLVEELRRRGQLTDDEAEDHPQRSIITRALGPRPTSSSTCTPTRSEAATCSCSAATASPSMVREERLHEILTSTSSLQQAVDELVEEANRMGGRDNITAILIRIGGDEPAPGADKEGQQETAEQTATDLPPVPPAEPPEPGKIEKKKARPAADPALRSRRRRRRLRVALVTGLVLLLLGGLAVGATAAIRSAYFIGQNDRGLVTLYRGVPYELPAGIKLYDTQYVSSVQARSLRPFERRRLLDHQLRSRSDAADRIRDLERGG